MAGIIKGKSIAYSGSLAAGASSGTIFTCPANTACDINAIFTHPVTAGYVTINGCPITFPFVNNGTTTLLWGPVSPSNYVNHMYLKAGDTVAVYNASGATTTIGCYISYAEET